LFKDISKTIAEERKGQNFTTETLFRDFKTACDGSIIKYDYTTNYYYSNSYIYHENLVDAKGCYDVLF
jgi:hypothetical protein